MRIKSRCVLSEDYVEEIVLAYEVCQLLVESSNLLSTSLCHYVLDEYIDSLSSLLLAFYSVLLLDVSGLL